MKKVYRDYLKCEINDGMFPCEYLITAKLYDGKEVEGFFDKCFVDKQKGLEVKVVESCGDKTTIIAPQYGFIDFFGNQWIKVVNTDQLTQNPQL